MPDNSEDMKIDEDGIEALGEVSELEPGHTGELTLHLQPGLYMLMCNIEGHFKEKMYTIVQAK